MTMPDSRGRRSLGVFAESQAIEAAQVMPAAVPWSARARSSTTAFGASANASVETVSSAEPASAMRRPPKRGVTRPESSPIDRRRQRIGGQHEARAGLGEVEAVGVARQQRHDRLVERRLDEHRQADRDRDAARVHDSILPARVCAGAPPAGSRQSSTMWMQLIRSFADATHAPAVRVPRPSDSAPRRHQTAPARERPERNPPRLPACYAAARLHGVDGVRRRGPGRTTCSRQCSPYWDSSSGLRSPPSCCAVAAARQRRCASRRSAS